MGKKKAQYVTLYHSTNSSAAGSIDCEGFRPGSGGRQGPGIYLSDKKRESKSRSQNGRDVTYAVTVNVNNCYHDGESYCVKNANQIKGFQRI